MDLLKNNDANDVVILWLDKPRELRLTNHAMKRFSALTGTTLTGMQDVIDHYDNMILLLWVMLSEDDPDLTPEILDDMIADAERRKDHRLKLATLIKTISTALAAALSDEDAEASEDTDADPMTAAGTGDEV